MTIFVVGQSKGEKPWEIHGVFDSEEKAIAACIDWTYFIGPITMNEILPQGTLKWPGGYYPTPKLKSKSKK